MSWQEELRKGIRSAEELAPILGWSPEETARRAEVAKRFPVMITPYYLSLVDPGDPQDPIGRMCIPSLDEFDQRRGVQHQAGGPAAQVRPDRAAAQQQPVRHVLPPLLPQADGGAQRG